jgi:methionine-rich copper-binding protein CopC
VLLAVVATVLGLTQTALADYAVAPVGPAWVPDGAVDAVLVSGSTVYVGGEFTGGYAALTADTGQLIWKGSADGSVRALALSGEGHLLLGGDFTTVGGATHRKLASVSLTDGSVNATYKAAAGGTVRDIVVVNGVEYFAGAFTNHGGMAQQGVGAVDTTYGKVVTSFTPTANGTVYALATDGTRLFLGGGFTTVNGATRNQLASVTLPTGSLDTWAPAKACTGNSLFWDITLGGNRIYGVGRNCASVYAVDTTTGRAVFRTSANGDSQAVTLAPDGLLYVGGHFNSVIVGGVTTGRTIVAAFNVSGTTPTLQPFSARFVTTYPGVWAMASSSTRLYVGGYFTAAGPKVNGQDVYPYLAFFPSGSSTAPAFTSGTPADNTNSVGLSANVTASFSTAVTNVGSSTFTVAPTSGGSAVAAAYSSNSAGTKWTLNPSANLASDTWYTVTLTSGITDASGNALASAPVTWKFLTGPAPKVQSTSPAAGATGVSPSTKVSANFSEAVQNVTPTTFFLKNAAGTTVATTIQPPSTGNKWSLVPSSPLTAGTYTATIVGGSGGVTDLAGNPMASTLTWSFTV